MTRTTKICGKHLAATSHFCLNFSKCPILALIGNKLCWASKARVYLHILSATNLVRKTGNLLNCCEVCFVNQTNSLKGRYTKYHSPRISQMT